MKTKADVFSIIAELKKLYPDGICSLDYPKPYELLFSVRLAAQCTDARVNVVVEDLYARYPDVEALAAQCRFRDCTHHGEPGCAVRAAVESGELTPERYGSYQALQQEMAAMRDRREEARRMNKEKVSDTKRRRAGAPKGKRRR